MASDKSLSLLRASLIIFLASLLLGSAAMYIQFGIVSVLVLWNYKWSRLKDTGLEIIKVSKPAWVMWLLFTVIFAITLVANQSVSISEIGELKWLFFPFVFVMALLGFLRETPFRTMEKVAIAFLFLVSIYSLVDSVYQVITDENIGRLLLFDEPSISSKRGAGLLKNPIPFAHVVGSLFYLGIAGAMISYSKGSQKVAFIFAGLSLLFFLCVLTSLARGAWLAIAVTALFSLIITPKAFKKANLIGLGIAALFGAGTLAFNGMLLLRFLSAFDPNEEANSARLHLWRSNWEMLIQNPFGIGFNANDLLLPEKLAELGFPASSFLSHPHNEYLDYAVATGFPGIGLYVGVTVWLLCFTVRMLRRANLNGSDREMFLLTSSVFIQSYLNVCALTDQFTTPGRFLICLAWAVPLAIAVKNRNAQPVLN